MADENIAILGGRGMLGSDLVIASRQQGFNISVFDLPEFDITDDAQLQKVVLTHKIVVNCAAYTNVEEAETNTDLAYRVNAEAVGRLGTLAKQADTWVLHISTDFVFDGKSNSPYVETDMPNPASVYGRTKLTGERLLVESRCRHCIIRIQWTYGLGGDNFVTKLYKKARSGKKLSVVDDQTGSPTATTEVAKVICTFLHKIPEGLFHFASAGCVSRFEMAKFIFDKLNMKVNLNPCKTSDYPTKAARPLNSCFNCAKISNLLDEPIEPWQGPLEQFLKQL